MGAAVEHDVAARQIGAAALARVAGTRPEVRVDLGFTGGPGFNAEGLTWRPDGTTTKGIAPENHWLPVESDDIDVYVEAAGNPDIGGVWGFKPTPLGDKATTGDARSTGSRRSISSSSTRRDRS